MTETREQAMARIRYETLRNSTSAERLEDLKTRLAQGCLSDINPYFITRKPWYSRWLAVFKRQPRNVVGF